jgi:hypothetical protein
VCEPATIATIVAVASAASAVATPLLQARAQQQYASAATQSINNQSAVDEYAINAKLQQEGEANAAQMSERALDAVRARGMLDALDTGLGQSRDRLGFEIGLNAATDMATLEANQKNQQAQALLSKRGVYNNSAAQLSQVKHPSLIGTGLAVVGGLTQSMQPVSRLPTSNARSIGYDSTPGSGP